MSHEDRVRYAQMGGLKNVESGQIQALGQSGIGGRSPKSLASKRLNGLRHIESGHIQALGRIQGPITGRKAVESGLLKRISSLGGRISGRKNVESGRLFTMAKKDTKPELAVKTKLDELVALKAISGYVHPFNLNNKFFPDFYVPEMNTIIEVDGCYWHGCEQCGFPGRKNDNGRNAYIKACGYNFEIIKEHELHGQ